MSVRRQALLLVVLPLLLVGCTERDGTPVGENLCGLYDATSPGPFRPDIPVLDAEAFVGKSLEEARAMAAQQDGSVRVVGQDGRCEETLSDDLAGNRVNVYLQDGRVKEARTF